MWLKRQRFPPATCKSSSDHKTLPGQLSKSRRTMSFNLEWPDWCPARPSHSGLKFVRVRKANIRPAGAGCRRFPGQGRMSNPPENANGPLIEEALHATHTTDFFWLPSQIKEGAPHQTHASLPACMYPRKLHICIYIYMYIYICVCVCMQVQAGKIEAAATQILPTLRHPTDLCLFKKSWGELEVEHRRISDNGPGRGCTRFSSHELVNQCH